MNVPPDNHEAELDSLIELGCWVESGLRRWEKGDIIALSGELGTGKTALVRCIISQLAVQKGVTCPRVVSPTFMIAQSYPEVGVEHFDFYRIVRLAAVGLAEIGYFEAIDRIKGHGYCFIEWPERVHPYELLRATRSITLEITGVSTRRIVEETRKHP